MVVMQLELIALRPQLNSSIARMHIVKPCTLQTHSQLVPPHIAAR
jgi:hypothetical protein